MKNASFFAATYGFKYLFLVNQTKLPPAQSGNKGIPISKQPGQADTPQLLGEPKVAMLEAPQFYTSCSS